MIGYKEGNGDKDTYNLLIWKAFDIWKHHLNSNLNILSRGVYS
jgi:hypothetical protein